MSTEKENNQTTQPEIQPVSSPVTPPVRQSREEGETILARKIYWTKVAIFLERFWIKLWGPLIIISLFLIASLYQLWPLLSPLLHRLFLAFFAMGFLTSLYPFFSLRWPNDEQALKRLDKHSTLPHQPAQAFKDNLHTSQSTNQTRALWINFKDRLVEKIKQLKVSPPQPDTYKKDPYALRMLLMLAVAIGLFFQGGHLRSLINNALAIPPMINTSNLRIDAWVTPPPYTAKPPILITDGGATQGIKSKTNANFFEIPQNSTFTIRINGENANHVQIESINKQIKPDNQQVSQSAGTPPALKMKAKTKEKPSQKNSKEFHLKLTQNGPVKITIDKIPLKDWRFKIVEDNPPIIGLIEIPTTAQSGALKLKYRVADDYGVISAKAHIKEIILSDNSSPPISNIDNSPLGSPVNYPLNLSQRGTISSKDTTYKDLTSHPWAGFPISLYLSAQDEGGNNSNSPEIQFTLPEYKFTKQIAKDIILLRKKLIIAPDESPLIAHSINLLTQNKKTFEKDLTLYLGLRVSFNRLLTADTRAHKEELATLLYQLARHAEDGDLSQAERELRTAQENLRKALQENAPNSEIQKRIENLRKALQKYMQALAKQQKKQSAENGQKNQNQQSLSPKDFEQMLKTIEELSKSGSKDLARQMLSQLQNMLENLQTGKNQRKQNQGTKSLEQLGKILRQQQKLMDKTFEQNRKQRQQSRQNSENNQGQQPNNQSKKQSDQNPDLEKLQQALRQQLQKLMQKLQKGQGKDGQGKNGKSLNNAGRAMGRAEELLKEKDLGNALSQEGQALDQLRKGMEQMAKDMQGMSGKGGSQKAGGTDPLGRPQSSKGMDTSESTKVPDKIDIQRAREILRNLQDKLSDPNRPAPEIDYIERLLKRF